MNNLFRWLAFLGPIMQFGMSIISVFITDFIDLKSKYSLSENLYLQPYFPAFFIWNIIFLSFIGLGIYQLNSSLKEDPLWITGRPYVFASCLGNTIWFLGDFYTNLSISLVGFVIMLIALTQINNIFSLGKKKYSTIEFALIKFPISVFYGWITIAFPIGVTLWLMKNFGLSGRELFSPEIWSAIVIFVALAIFGSLYFKDKVSTTYVVVGIWGLYWIFVANNNIYPIIAYSALFSIAILIILIGSKVFTNQNWQLEKTAQND